MSDTGIEKFRVVVLDDFELQSELRGVGDRAEFIRLVTGKANEKGFELTADDVEEAMRAGRRAWIERWI
jgi:hypothetical protein